jgi:calcineurin-like phosphoesterase family protein
MGINNKMKRYIWSDLHLNHKRIIDYCNRPFENVETMNKTILDNWKNVVKNDDIIFNLGDVIWGNKEKAESIIKDMPGKKILIMGNHDREHSVTWFRDVGFDEVYPYPILYKNFFIISHEPVFLNESMPYCNLHGHIHNISYDYKGYINVSVDKTNFMPINLDELVDKIIKENNPVEE